MDYRSKSFSWSGTDIQTQGEIDGKEDEKYFYRTNTGTNEENYYFRLLEGNDDQRYFSVS